MTPCAKHSTSMDLLRTGLAIVLGAAILAGCSTKSAKPDRPSPPDVMDQKPADGEGEEPAAEKATPEERFAEALTLMKQGKTAEAEKAFLDLSKDVPDATGPHTNLGIIFAATKRTDAAIAAFTRAANADGSNASAFNWLGILNRKAGNYERARLSFEKAIEVQPDYKAAHLNLGLLLEQSLNQPTAAVEHYRAYQRLAGDKDLRVLPWIAEIESRQTQNQAASESIDEVEVK